ncbi:sensor histidine kinase [Reinekea thalattae]|nr:HAMP domain-containing sensor histidine kinase [Reinekea thalattae]
MNDNSRDQRIKTVHKLLWLLSLTCSGLAGLLVWQQDGLVVIKLCLLLVFISLLVLAGLSRRQSHAMQLGHSASDSDTEHHKDDSESESDQDPATELAKQRKELIATLTSGVAHDINNPLSVIQQNVQNINRRLGEPLAANQTLAAELNIDLNQLKNYLTQRDIFEFLNQIEQSALRASELSQNLLQFSQTNAAPQQVFTVAELIERSLAMTYLTPRYQQLSACLPINIKTDIANPNEKISGIFIELQQVLINLIDNALDAIEERRQCVQDILQADILLEQKTTRDKQCLISVSDNGMGMDEATQQRLFEPSFTTKASGHGIGLALCQQIVSQHHQGKLSVTSKQGVGSCLSIKLPLTNN